MSPLYDGILTYSMPCRHSGFLTPTSYTVCFLGTLCPECFNIDRYVSENKPGGDGGGSVCVLGKVKFDTR